MNGEDKSFLARVRKWGQARFHLGAQILEGRRQGEPLAEVLLGLICREAWAHGRDLEQDTTRLPKVDRPEVEAIDHRRRVAAASDDLVAPGLVVLHGRGPRDVVDRA